MLNHMTLMPYRMIKNIVAKLVSMNPKIKAKIAGDIVVHIAIFKQNQKVI